MLNICAEFTFLIATCTRTAYPHMCLLVKFNIEETKTNQNPNKTQYTLTKICSTMFFECFISGSTPAVVQISKFGLGDGPTWMDEMQCTGREVDIALCTFKGWGKEDCGHSEDVGITCGSYTFSFQWKYYCLSHYSSMLNSRLF